MAEIEVAVIGAGPAGIAAAAAAAEAGRRVVLIDESPRPGGQIWRHREGEAAPAARPWLRRLERSGAEVRSGTAVVDLERVQVDGAGSGTEPRIILTLEDGAGEPQRLQARGLVLATGARERFLPFPGWTLPGVVGIGGAQALLKSGTSFAGRRVVVAGSGPLLLPVSAALAKVGGRLQLIAEQAPLSRVSAFAVGLWRQPTKMVEATRYRLQGRAARYRTGSWVVRARGDGRVEEVEVRSATGVATLRCDLLCTGFGLVPNLSLARLLGCALSGGFVQVDAEQRTGVPGVWCAGEGTGIGGMEVALAEGMVAGSSAAGSPGRAASYQAVRDRGRRFAARMTTAFALRPELRALAEDATTVCRCEDVRMGALRGEWTGRQAKLYTRIGMGPCQGRVCGPAAEILFGWDLESDRMPASVATIETLACASDDERLPTRSRHG